MRELEEAVRDAVNSFLEEAQVYEVNEEELEEGDDKEKGLKPNPPVESPIRNPSKKQVDALTDATYGVREGNDEEKDLKEWYGDQLFESLKRQWTK